MGMQQVSVMVFQVEEGRSVEGTDDVGGYGAEFWEGVMEGGEEGVEVDIEDGF